jgi:hypothetical protein
MSRPRGRWAVSRGGDGRSRGDGEERRERGGDDDELARCEQQRPGGGESLLVLAAPEALVADHDLRCIAGEQAGERLVLLLVCGYDRVAERQPALVGQKHQAHTPDEAVRRLR